MTEVMTYLQSLRYKHNELNIYFLPGEDFARIQTTDPKITKKLVKGGLDDKGGQFLVDKSAIIVKPYNKAIRIGGMPKKRVSK